jgi:hypothetical protein
MCCWCTGSLLRGRVGGLWNYPTVCAVAVPTPSDKKRRQQRSMPSYSPLVFMRRDRWAAGAQTRRSAASSVASEMDDFFIFSSQSLNHYISNDSEVRFLEGRWRSTDPGHAKSVGSSARGAERGRSLDRRSTGSRVLYEHWRLPREHDLVQARVHRDSCCVFHQMTQQRRRGRWQVKPFDDRPRSV